MNFDRSTLYNFTMAIFISFTFSISFKLVAVEVPITPELKLLFPSASHTNQEDKGLSITPVYQLGTLAGYSFHSAEIFPVRGYGGKPIDIMIGLTPEGLYTGFVVIDHYEPIFIKGDGPQKLERYMAQLTNVSASNNIFISGDNKNEIQSSGKSTYIDGITSATVTTNAINKTITKSARAVARAKQLAGYASLSRNIPKVGKFEVLTLQQLVETGLIKYWPIYKQQVDTAKMDKKLGYPSQPVSMDNVTPLAKIYLAYVSHPLVAKNILSENAYQAWINQYIKDEQYLLILGKGQWQQKTLSSRLSLKQRNTEIIRKPFELSQAEESIAERHGTWDEISLLRIPTVANFNPLDRMKLTFNATKQAKLVDIYQLPTEYFITDNSQLTDDIALWKQLWEQRKNEIALLLLGLVLLSILFLNQHYAVLNQDSFHKIRLGYLLFTIIFIGYYAQGQLSIVNILTFQHLLMEGASLAPFLLDPMISILWCFVLVSLVFFGRGVFCGWLCPFGALQELAGIFAAKLNIKKWKISTKWHNQLQKLKYLLLIIIVGGSFFSLSFGATLAELEPFKTSITLYFIREWQYVIYAVLLLLIAMKIHKFYCRYLCPLGACLALFGAFPIFNWLTRRAECGTPCQKCRVNCEIDAISKQGNIDMKECIQCLECVVINSSPTLCAIEVVATKKRRRKERSIEIIYE
ncbi:MAG: NosR/NirI family nitrous oxide reductase transcriptional regulator [Alteromonadaceae bacterium]|jgi:NosR/NirI family nitrous oxide reductase transcriptional regulator